MKRVMLYTQDKEGLGNIRWIISMCQSLIGSFQDLSILIVSGAAMGESFRIPEGIDYIKLPKLINPDSEISAYDPILKLRADILVCSAANFKPNVMIVDRKPFGIQNELRSTLAYLHEYLPETKVTLILQDILDSPEATQILWTRQEYAATIEQYYDEISVLGSPEVFDPRIEYGFTPAMTAITRFWGYIHREPGEPNRPMNTVKVLGR